MANSYGVSSLGDGLFTQGGNLICELPVVSVKKTEGSGSGTAVFEYETYSIKVTYSIDGDKRYDPRWERIYKEASA